MSVFSKIVSAIKGNQKVARPVGSEDTEPVQPSFDIPTVQFDSKLVTDAVKDDLKDNIGNFPDFSEGDFYPIYDAALLSISMGRNSYILSKAILDLNISNMTKKRAGEIAMSLNNAATALINRDRQIALGIEYAIWAYSGAPCMLNPRHPTTAERRMNETHKAADGKRFRVADGLALNGHRTWPGRREGCKCYSTSVVPGLRQE